MKRCIVELATAMFLAGLALGLLIQYYRGGWSDSNRIIVIAEIAILCALFALGASYTVWRVTREVIKQWKED